MQMSALSLTTIDATTQMHPSHITSPFFDLPAVSPTLLTIFTTLEGTSAMLEGTSTQLLTTFGDTRRMKRKHVTAVTRQQMQSTSPQVGLQTGLRLSLSE